MTDSALVPRARTRPHHCPHCESVHIARSRRQGIWGLPLFRLLRVHMYRCTDCWRRFRAIGNS